jgi:hypothetical protein
VFKGKYFVSVIRKFGLSVLIGNAGLLPLHQLGGLSQFICIRLSLIGCLCNEHYAVVNSAMFFLLKLYEAVKHAYHAYNPDAVALIKPTIFIALMMEAIRTSETSVNFNVTIWRYIPEDSKLHF